MRPSRFTDAEKIQALRQVSAGIPAIAMCRQLGITQTTFYRWRTALSGPAVSDMRELRELRDENEKLKLIVADMLLDKHRVADARRES